ncbi:MAG: hypothetical protein KC547_13680 [Anaerolineae bacterium]|nr:hypothetical protein [Anaerolineae bacterium]
MKRLALITLGLMLALLAVSKLGARIAYSCQIARGTAAICIYDLVSSEFRAITSSTFGARDLEPAWRPGIGQP